MKKIVLALIIFCCHGTYAQVFIKMRVQFMSMPKNPPNTYVDIPMSLGVEFEKKIGVDKAISIGISNRSYKFSTDVNWISNNDFMAYVRDYTKDDLIDAWLSDPEINFHYINVPIGFRVQSRLFFGFKYQLGLNFLLKKPEFKEDNYTVPIPFDGHSPLVVDHTATVFFTAFGFFDMFGSYTFSQPFVKNNAYSYDFMMDFISHPSFLSYGMSFPLTKIKRKKI